MEAGIQKVVITGTNGMLKLPGKKAEINLQDSGTSLRLLSAVSVLADGEVLITGSDRLKKRPLDRLLQALKSQGAIIDGSRLPVKIKGTRLKGGKLTIDSEDSSQFASALMLIAPFALKPLKLEALNLSSSPYLAITLSVMEKFGVKVVINRGIFEIPVKGYKSASLKIEGDYTSASYFLVAKYILGHNITVENLNKDSLQGDRAIYKILQKLRNGGNLEFEMNSCPDLVPAVAVAAGFNKGNTKITGISHLRHKESDRVKSVIAGLKIMGIKAGSDGSSLTIEGGTPYGGTIETFNDHRIAMSFAIAALNAQSPSIIKNSQVVDKSYPDFWNDLRVLGAQITYLD